MYVEIHSKDELGNPEGRGKRTYVNFTIGKDNIRIARDRRSILVLPLGHLEYQRFR